MKSQGIIGRGGSDIKVCLLKFNFKELFIIILSLLLLIFIINTIFFVNIFIYVYIFILKLIKHEIDKKIKEKIHGC